MGSSPSKPNSDSQHVFSAETPVNFSQNLVNSLQKSSETNGTRAKQLELLIQSRVTSELEKLLSTSNAKFADIAESVSNEPLPKDQQPADTASSEKSLFGKISEKLSSGNEADSEFRGNLTRDEVQKQIADLKKKLDGRRKVAEKDKDVEKAREDMVACLRLNDRRPLDCWKQVEKFRTEVGRLERGFVDRNGS